MDAIEFYLFHLIEMGTKLEIERYVFKELKPFIIYMCNVLSTYVFVTNKSHRKTTLHI
jgi:hypothetical protein